MCHFRVKAANQRRFYELRPTTRSARCRKYISPEKKYITPRLNFAEGFSPCSVRLSFCLKIQKKGSSTGSVSKRERGKKKNRNSGELGYMKIATQLLVFPRRNASACCDHQVHVQGTLHYSRCPLLPDPRDPARGWGGRWVPLKLWVRVVVIGLSGRMRRPPGRTSSGPWRAPAGVRSRSWCANVAARTNLWVWFVRRSSSTDIFTVCLEFNISATPPLLSILYLFLSSFFFAFLSWFVAHINNISSPSCNYCNRFAITLVCFPFPAQRTPGSPCVLAHCLQLENAISAVFVRPNCTWFLIFCLRENWRGRPPQKKEEQPEMEERGCDEWHM